MKANIYDAQERILLGVAEEEDYRLVHVPHARPITTPMILKAVIVSFFALTTIGLFVIAVSEALQ